MVDITGLMDTSLHSLNVTFEPFPVSYPTVVNNLVGTIIEEGLL